VPGKESKGPGADAPPLRFAHPIAEKGAPVRFVTALGFGQSQKNVPFLAGSANGNITVDGGLRSFIGQIPSPASKIGRHWRRHLALTGIRQTNLGWRIGRHDVNSFGTTPTQIGCADAWVGMSRNDNEPSITVRPNSTSSEEDGPLRRRHGRKMFITDARGYCQ